MTIKKDIFMVLDTETCDLTGSVYDVGYTIADRKGNIATTRNWLVQEIFTDAKKMMGAFYAKKMFSHYAPMLNDGAVKLAAWSDIVQTMRDDCAAFGVTSIAAYNAAFDFRVMAATHKMLGNTDRILPAGLKKLCIWQFACETKLSQKSYVKMALANGWVSPKGNIKTGAEFAYRYTTHRPEFVEDHTALPGGTGKKVKVAVVCEDAKAQEAKDAGADIVGSDEFIEKIKAGELNFEKLICTPGMMIKLSKLGKVLGPKGLMPNPKLGSVSENIKEAVTNAKSGQAEIRNDKDGNIGVSIGKKSFHDDQLLKNFHAILDTLEKEKGNNTLKGDLIKNTFVTS